MSCSKCKEELPKEESKLVTCGGCNTSVHPNCTGVRKQYLTQDAKDKWRCDNCKVKTPPIYFDKTQFLEEIREDIKKEVRKCFESLREEFRKELKDLIQSVTTLEKKVELQDKIISNLTIQIANLDQYGRNRNFELHNIEEKPGEVVEDIVLKVAKHLNIPLDKENIEAAHRLPSRKNPSLAPKIIVQLSSRKKRNEFVECRRQLAPITSNLLVQGGASVQRVYLNENLSPYYRELLWRAKELGKSAGFKFIWFKSGKILVSKGEGDKNIIKISSFEELKKISDISALNTTTQR